MNEELQELMNSNPEWYKNLQYDDVKVFIKANLNNATRCFVVIGYYLKYARDNVLFKEVVQADIIQTEPEDKEEDEELETIDPEHYTWRDVDDELDKLTEYVELYRKNNDTALGRRKSKMRYDAIVLLDKELKKKPVVVKEPELNPIQPELPILKNNDQRTAFVDAYETWPVWIETKETEERYYRYDLSDNASMVVKVYYSRLFDYKAIGEKYEDRFKDGWGKEEYYLLKPEKHFRDCETNKSALIDYLKEVQKK